MPANETSDPKLPKLPEYRPRYPAALALYRKSQQDTPWIMGASVAGGAIGLGVLVWLGLTATATIAIGVSACSFVGALAMSRWLR